MIYTFAAVVSLIASALVGFTICVEYLHQGKVVYHDGEQMETATIVVVLILAGSVFLTSISSLLGVA